MSRTKQIISPSVITPPFLEVHNPYNITASIKKRIFLGGSIDMGSSVDWQKKLPEDIMAKFEELKYENISTDFLFVNPRRKDWDSSWEQKYDNPQFNHQVNWELDRILESDLVVFNILPESKSPISLLEIGLCAGKGIPTIVLCPDEFYRSGNVEIVCRRFPTLQLFKNYDSFVNAIMREISKK